MEKGSSHLKNTHTHTFPTEAHCAYCALIIGCCNRQTSPILFLCHLLHLHPPYPPTTVLFHLIHPSRPPPFNVLALLPLLLHLLLHSSWEFCFTSPSYCIYCHLLLVSSYFPCLLLLLASTPLYRSFSSPLPVITTLPLSHT